LSNNNIKSDKNDTETDKNDTTHIVFMGILKGFFLFYI